MNDETPEEKTRRLRGSRQEFKPGDTTEPSVVDFLSIDTWCDRDIPEPDRLLGDLITTTTRAFFVGRTGLGKTQLGMAIACGMASGEGFLHWRSTRPARVLYVDGEMPGELIKSRAKDAIRRSGRKVPPGNLMIFARDMEEEFSHRFPTIGSFATLNSEAGHNFIHALIDAVGQVDVIIFDNLMSLTTGDQKEELTFTDTHPLIAALTAKRIGQLWFDHTGHDSSRQYGSSTKSWRFDTVGIMTPLANEQAIPGEMGFNLSFDHPGKARRRTPDNRADFEPCTIRLSKDRWTSDANGTDTRGPKLSPRCRQFYGALLDSLSATSTPGRTTRKAWFGECVRTGLADGVEPSDDYRIKEQKQKKFRTYFSELKAAGLIGVDGETVTDLRSK